MTPKLETAETVTTTRRHTFRLEASHIVALMRVAGYSVAGDAKVTFTVPGGGDYSNMVLDLDKSNPIEVTWETKDVAVSTSAE